MAFNWRGEKWGIMNRDPSNPGNSFVALLLALILWALDFLLAFDGLNIKRLYVDLPVFLKILQGSLGLGLFIALLVYVYSNKGSESEGDNLVSPERIRDTALTLVLGMVISVIVTFGGFNPGVIVHIIIPFFIISYCKPGLSIKEIVPFILLGYFIDFFLFGLLNSYVNNPILGNRLVIPIWVLYASYQASRFSSRPGVKTFASIIFFTFILIYTVRLADGVRILDETKRLGVDQVRTAGEYYRESFEKIRDGAADFWSELTSWDLMCFATGECADDDQVIIQEREFNVEAKILEDQFEQEGKYELGEKIQRRVRLKVIAEERSISGTVECFIDTGELDESTADTEDHIIIYGKFKKGADYLDFYEFESNVEDEFDLVCEFDTETNPLFTEMADDDAGGLEDKTYFVTYKINYEYSTIARTQIFLMDKERRRQEIGKLEVREWLQRNAVIQPPLSTSGPLKLGIRSHEGIIGLEQDTPETVPFNMIVTNQDTRGHVEEINTLLFYVPISSGMSVDYDCKGGYVLNEVSTQAIDPEYEDIIKKYKLYSLENTAENLEDTILGEDKLNKEVVFNCILNIGYPALEWKLTEKILFGEIHYTYQMEIGDDRIEVLAPEVETP